MPVGPGASPAKISDDFARIATLPADPAEGNLRYHSWLLACVPADRVLGIDLSPGMIAGARSHSRALANLDFEQIDALTWPWPVDRYDRIVSITCLHPPPHRANPAEDQSGAPVPAALFPVLDEARLSR